MSFSSAGFVPFLLAIYALYASLGGAAEQHTHSSSSLARRATTAAITALATVALADLLWLLAIPGASLADPLELVFRAAFGAGHAPLTARAALGPALFALGYAIAHRARSPDPATGPRRATVAALALGALGVAFAWAVRRHALPELSRALASLGHPAWLFAWGSVRAFDAQPSRDAQRVAKQSALFLVSALMYHSWAATTRGAYQYLLALILATVVLDYGLALVIERRRGAANALSRARLWLIGSFVANLGILCAFKYWDFFGTTASAIARALGAPWTYVPIALLLPAGISFHTFQSLSYTVDVYKQKLRATPSLLEFATFVLFFPQLVAGPIVRAEEFLPQIADPPPIRETAALEGLLRVARGLAKKLCLADPLAVFLVDRVFDRPNAYSSLENLLAVYGYAFQIYLDFSAYSDIAIGAAAMLGFTLPENFRTPYRAADLSAFWRRWHITLSSWLRDYLYIPLGGSRGSDWATYRNLSITMLLGGLWHGANWTFIAWGALHGGGLAITRAYQRHTERTSASPASITARAALFALFGTNAHKFIAPSIDRWATVANVNSAWVHLVLGWCYLAPLWAALTVWSASRADAGSRLARVASAALTFHYVCFAWVFFRAPSFERAREVLFAMGERTTDVPNVPKWFAAALVGAALAHFVPDAVYDRARRAFVAAHPLVRSMALVAVFVALRSISLPATVPFIYFQF
ncbi:MAG: MBOAT family protein [Myxococcales bacterium]|nr:MBOAT family protein [Myxococcales bacterium]